MAVPAYDKMFDALLSAVRQLGGSASIEELEDKTATEMKLDSKDLSQIHKGNTTKFSYNLAWARTYLKKFEVLENSERGVWSLTNKGQQLQHIDPAEVKKFVKVIGTSTTAPEDLGEDAGLTWEDQLLETVKGISPKAFERLAQRILRESGFVQVEVTGQSSDGGIDGRGVVRLNLLSFHVHFQCKRYKDSVSAEKVRDFRGAMVGRSDKGLFMTTGRFTPETKKEASRDGAPPLELIDSEELARMLKNLRLGVKVTMVESIEIDSQWFSEFDKVNS